VNKIKRFLFFISLVILTSIITLNAQDSSCVSFVSSRFNYWDRALGIDAVGNLSYISTGQTGIQVVSYPNRWAEIIDQTDQLYSTDVFVTDSYIFSRDFFQGFSILRRDNFEIISTWEEPGRYTDLLIRDDNLFLADTSGLLIFDITELENPALMHSIELPGHTVALCISDDMIFASCNSAELIAIDISDIENPQIVAEIEHEGNPLDVEVIGNYAIIAADRFGLRIIDISDPENPEERDPYIPEEWFRSFHKVKVRGNIVFSLEESGNIYFCEINEEGEINELLNYWYLSGVRDFSVDGDNLHCSWEIISGKGSSFWDISDLHGIEPHIKMILGLAYKVKNYGDLTLMVEGPPNGDWWNREFEEINDMPGIHILNTRNPSFPAPTNKFGWDFYYDVCTDGDLAYVLNDGFWEIYDLTGFRGGEPIFDEDDAEEDAAITADGSIFCISNDREELIEIWDTSTPQESVLASTIELNCRDIFLTENLLYCQGDELRIYNLENLEEPRLISTLDDLVGFGIKVDGDLAFVHTSQEEMAGIQLINISDPENPAMLSFCDSPGHIYDFDVQNGFIYLACGRDHGMILIDATDPENPEQAGFYDTRGRCYSVAANEQFAYVADGYNLGVFDCSAALGINAPPQWSVLPGGIVVFSETDTARFDIAVSDINDDEITITMEMEEFPEEAQFIDNGDGTAHFEWITNYEDAGNHTGRLRASDGVHEINRPLRVRIENTNCSPQPFDLNLPENNTILRNFRATFQWNPSVDIDADTINYKLYLRFPFQERDTLFSWDAGSDIIYRSSNLEFILNRLDLAQDTTRVIWYLTASDTEFTVQSNQTWTVILPPTLGIPEKNENLPTEITMLQPYPNPFNNQVTVKFGLPVRQFTNVSIYDQRGRLNENLVEGEMASGNHSIKWDAKTATAGIYFVKMECGEFSGVRKVVLVR
jgi:hypothetical protein